MRSIALLFCLLMITMPMAGCIGGDDSNEKLDDWNVHFAATVADLPSDEDTGRLYYVEADGQFQVCKTSRVIDIQGADGQDGLMVT